jgi:hypothetical protein
MYADTLAGAGPEPSFEISVPPPPPPIDENTALKKSRRGRRVAIGFLVFAAVFGGAFGGAKALMAKEETHVINGEFTLIDTDSDYRSISSSGQNCLGTRGYDDIRAGAQVLIKDGDGKPLSTTQLGFGNTLGTSRCVFTFSTDELPKRDFYVLEVSHRGELTFSYDDLVSKNWEVSTSLGN